MRRCAPSLLFALAASAAVSLTPPSSAGAAEPLSESEFRELCEQLLPPETEPWRTIPWKISLLDAQRAAASVRKPIFIWAMDGHPLGCT